MWLTNHDCIFDYVDYCAIYQTKIDFYWLFEEHQTSVHLLMFEHEVCHPTSMLENAISVQTNMWKHKKCHKQTFNKFVKQSLEELLYMYMMVAWYPFRSYNCCDFCCGLHKWTNHSFNICVSFLCKGNVHHFIYSELDYSQLV